MADWKTYARAARNTARKQAPGARDATQRATSRAGAYARAAGRALESEPGQDEGRRPTGAPRDEQRQHSPSAPRDDERQPVAAAPRGEGRPQDGPRSSRLTTPRPAPRAETPSRSLRDEAKLYAVVAGRTAERAGKQVRAAGIGRRIFRAVRDALLIGGSLLVIWGVLYAAGLPIPFSAVLIVVGVIVLIALAGGLYAQFKQDRQPASEPEGPEAR